MRRGTCIYCGRSGAVTKLDYMTRHNDPQTGKRCYGAGKPRFTPDNVRSEVLRLERYVTRCEGRPTRRTFTPYGYVDEVDLARERLMHIEEVHADTLNT